MEISRVNATLVKHTSFPIKAAGVISISDYLCNQYPRSFVTLLLPAAAFITFCRGFLPSPCGFVYFGSI